MSYTWDTTTTNIGTGSWTTTGTVSIPSTTITLDGEILRAEDISFLHELKNGQFTINNKKKDNKMNLEFGPCGDRAKISPLGISIKNANNEWVSYDKEKHEIVNVDLLNFGNSNFVYMIPVALKDIAEGDAIIHNKHIMFVKKIRSDGITVVDVTDGEYKKILPTKSMFGFDFITKVVSIMDFVENEASEDNPFGDILPFLLLGGDNKSDVFPLFLMMNKNLSNTNLMMYALMTKSSNDLIPFLAMMMK